jgi:hypothetical protein
VVFLSFHMFNGRAMAYNIWNKFSNIINIYEISRSALAYLTLENFYNGIYGTRRCTNRICLQKSQI